MPTRQATRSASSRRACWSTAPATTIRPLSYRARFPPTIPIRIPMVAAPTTTRPPAPGRGVARCMARTAGRARSRPTIPAPGPMRAAAPPGATAAATPMRAGTTRAPGSAARRSKTPTRTSAGGRARSPVPTRPSTRAAPATPTARPVRSTPRQGRRARACTPRAATTPLWRAGRAAMCTRARTATSTSTPRTAGRNTTTAAGRSRSSPPATTAPHPPPRHHTTSSTRIGARARSALSSRGFRSHWWARLRRARLRRRRALPPMRVRPPHPARYASPTSPARRER